MAREHKPIPGGYNSVKVFRVGTCVCCRGNPIAKGNFFLCGYCHTDPHNLKDRVDPDRVTEEDALELIVKVAKMELTPPTPVTRFSCDDYTQEQLQEILDGGVP